MMLESVHRVLPEEETDAVVPASPVHTPTAPALSLLGHTVNVLEAMIANPPPASAGLGVNAASSADTSDLPSLGDDDDNVNNQFDGSYFPWAEDLSSLDDDNIDCWAFPGNSRISFLERYIAGLSHFSGSLSIMKYLFENVLSELSKNGALSKDPQLAQLLANAGPDGNHLGEELVKVLCLQYYNTHGKNIDPAFFAQLKSFFPGNDALSNQINGMISNLEANWKTVLPTLKSTAALEWGTYLSSAKLQKTVSAFNMYVVGSLEKNPKLAANILYLYIIYILMMNSASNDDSMAGEGQNFNWLNKIAKEAKDILSEINDPANTAPNADGKGIKKLFDDLHRLEQEIDGSPLGANYLGSIDPQLKVIFNLTMPNSTQTMDQFYQQYKNDPNADWSQFQAAWNSHMADPTPPQPSPTPSPVPSAPTDKSTVINSITSVNTTITDISPIETSKLQQLANIETTHNRTANSIFSKLNEQNHTMVSNQQTS